MSTKLKDIVDKSYEVFKKYDATAPLDVCTACCLTKEQENALITLPVRDIPFKLLYDYNTAAKTKHPRIEEFKHFLPRFLEITADLNFLHHSAELVLSRFDYYDKSEWSDEEQALIQNFASAYFCQYLSVYTPSALERVDAILIMLSKTKVDMQPILACWMENTSPESVFHFKDLVIGGFKTTKPDQLISSFAGQELTGAIIEWLDKQATKSAFADKIEKIIMEPAENIDERTLNELSWTYEIVRHNN